MDDMGMSMAVLSMSGGLVLAETCPAHQVTVRLRPE